MEIYDESIVWCSLEQKPVQSRVVFKWYRESSERMIFLYSTENHLKEVEKLSTRVYANFQHSNRLNHTILFKFEVRCSFNSTRKQLQVIYIRPVKWNFSWTVRKNWFSSNKIFVRFFYCLERGKHSQAEAELEIFAKENPVEVVKRRKRKIPQNLTDKFFSFFRAIWKKIVVIFFPRSRRARARVGGAGDAFIVVKSFAPLT